MTNLMDSLVEYQKKLDEKTVKEYTEEFYGTIRKIILEEVKLLDPEVVKQNIINDLDVTKNVNIDLGENSDEKKDGNDEENYYDFEDKNHKNNTLILKMREEMRKSFIPTGGFLFNIAHNYLKSSENTFDELNNDEFIKAIQTILTIDCMPITFNVREYCDMSYRSSFFPYLCFHTNKINIESDSDDPFLQKLKEYKKKYDKHTLEEAKKKGKEVKKDTSQLKAEFTRWVVKNRNHIFNKIRETVIDSKIANSDDYTHKIYDSCYSDFNLKDLEHEWKSEELKKIINIQNIEIVNANFSHIIIVFTPSKLVLDELKISEEDIFEEKKKIEVYKEETRKNILKWASDSKEEIIELFYHFLKVRKYYSEKKEKFDEYILTDFLNIKKYCQFFKREETETIDVSKYSGILTQAVKDKLNEILGVTGFEFKTRSEFCNCGLPWGINREDSTIYCHHDTDNIEHKPDCGYKLSFNYICSDDDYKLYIFLPKTI